MAGAPLLSFSYLSTTFEHYRYWGLKRRTNTEAREEYREEVNALLEDMGLQVPDPNEGRLYL